MVAVILGIILLFILGIIIVLAIGAALIAIICIIVFLVFAGLVYFGTYHGLLALFGGVATNWVYAGTIFIGTLINGGALYLFGKMQKKEEKRDTIFNTKVCIS